MRYMPGDRRFNPSPTFQHAIYLARGKDLAGNAYEDPTSVFEPGKNRWCRGALH